jgi:hypothetical protein
VKREAEEDWGKAIEINRFQKRLTDEACLLRGKIIAGYSLVEYVLADISCISRNSIGQLVPG